MGHPPRRPRREPVAVRERRPGVVGLEEGAADPVHERLVHAAYPTEQAQRPADPRSAGLGGAEPEGV